MELKELDFEGRAVITQHKIKVSYQINSLIYPAITLMEFHSVHANYLTVSEVDITEL
jgi:hypothetical protein